MVASDSCYISTLGQDSHRFKASGESGRIILGGASIPFELDMDANSDGDVILHALTNAISGYTCRNILGQVADKLCLDEGVTDSKVYLKLALDDLSAMKAKIVHVSISVECKRPKLSPFMEDIRLSLSNLLGLSTSSIGITATTGEGLTSFGCGEGIQVFSIITIKTN